MVILELEYLHEIGRQPLVAIPWDQALKSPIMLYLILGWMRLGDSAAITLCCNRGEAQRSYAQVYVHVYL